MRETIAPAASVRSIDAKDVTLLVSRGERGGTRTEVWCYDVLGQHVPDTSPYIDDVPAAIARARLLCAEFGRPAIVMLYDDSTIVWDPEWQRAA